MNFNQKYKDMKTQEQIRAEIIAKEMKANKIKEVLTDINGKIKKQ